MRSCGIRADWQLIRAPLTVVAIYLAIAACVTWAAASSRVAISACGFRLVTGLPCPSCGGTRAALALVTGHLGDAWRFNPLVTCAYIAGPLWLGLRYFAPRPRPMTFSWPVRLIATGLLVLAIAANWAYLIAIGV